MKMNTIYCGDCVEELARLPEGRVDLVFADPPFNIGYQYDVYEDKKGYDDYLEWTRRWVEACCRTLKPDGTLWIAIGAEFAAETRILGRQLGLTLRNWIIWHYTFGQCTKLKFGRSHAHLFYFVKDPKNFTFNGEAVRVMSDRQKEYADRRANRNGRIPEDVWSQFSRVCGTFQERQTWHPCQMPESILARIIRTSSNRGSVVLDPFVGSGTTTTTAAKLGRRYLGTELSPEYQANAVQRSREAEKAYRAACGASDWPDLHVEQLKWLYGEVELATDELRQVPMFQEVFANMLNARLADLDARYEPDEVLRELVRLRRASQLPRIKRHVVEPQSDPDPAAKSTPAAQRYENRRRREARLEERQDLLFPQAG